MKKLAAFIFALLISLSFHADARLVSGTAQHQHDSATGGGAAINNTSIGSNSKIAPSIFVYDSAAPANEKYWKFGNSNGDFVLFTYDDAQNSASIGFTYSRTGTAPGIFELGNAKFSSTKSCDAGFTRVSPNLCRKTTTFANNLLTNANCTGISVPSGAIHVGVSTDLVVKSSNVVGLNSTKITSHIDATCNTAYEVAYASYYEYVATVAGTIIGRVAGDNLHAPVINGFIYLRADGNGSGSYDIMEYFD